MNPAGERRAAGRADAPDSDDAGGRDAGGTARSTDSASPNTRSHPPATELLPQLPCTHQTRAVLVVSALLVTSDPGGGGRQRTRTEAGPGGKAAGTVAMIELSDSDPGSGGTRIWSPTG